MNTSLGCSGKPELHESSRPRVVIAEDFVLIQESIRLLVQLECDVVAAVEDGTAALAAVAEHNPDLLLMDISLSDMSGFVVAEKLKAIGSLVRVVFVTAHREQVYVRRAFDIGAVAYVLKGSIRSQLLPAIRSAMQGGTFCSVMT